MHLAAGHKRIAARRDFRSGYDGLWQELPPEIVAALNSGGFDVILKFGLGLLRVPPSDKLGIPILSFHHGDPDHYRGRPAGFWEIADAAATMGQVVQVITNRLDAGGVVAFAETRIMPWSYRATLIQAFRHSPLLINLAIRNAIEGNTLGKGSAGRNCRLPSNGQTIRFFLKMAARFARKLLYGAAVEKRWQVSTATLGDTEVAAILTGKDFPSTDRWSDSRSPAALRSMPIPSLRATRPGFWSRRSTRGRVSAGSSISKTQRTSRSSRRTGTCLTPR